MTDDEFRSFWDAVLHHDPHEGPFWLTQMEHPTDAKAANIALTSLLLLMADRLGMEQLESLDKLVLEAFEAARDPLFGGPSRSLEERLYAICTLMGERVDEVLTPEGPR